jgi:hypothetical protein
MPISQRTLAPGDDRYGLEKLTNGGFETAGGGGADVFGSWAETAGDGALADEGVLVHSGSHAAKLTAGATKNTRISQGPITNPAGATYQLTFWTRGDGTNQGYYLVQDRDGWGILASGVTGVTGTTYTQRSVSFTMPAGHTSGWLLNLYNPLSAGGIAYFDDVSVKQIMGI